MEVLENIEQPFLPRKSALAIEAKMGLGKSIGGRDELPLSHPYGGRILFLLR